MKRGIGVIMDVVYNHTYSSYSSPFQTIPSPIWLSPILTETG